MADDLPTVHPDLVIVLLTYRRTDVACRTIEAAERLRYAGTTRWYIADDGSDSAHVEAVVRACEQTRYPILGMHSNRGGYGANANRAWREAGQATPVTLWLEDDWVLKDVTDVTDWVQALMTTQDIGLIRLGVLDQNNIGRVWCWSGRHYWMLSSWPYQRGVPVFTGHPSLRHQRYADQYGWYPEGLAPGETELAYAWQFHQMNAQVTVRRPEIDRHQVDLLGYDGHGLGVRPLWPEGRSAIVYPADIGPWGLFDHIGNIKTESLL